MNTMGPKTGFFLGLAFCYLLAQKTFRFVDDEGRWCRCGEHDGSLLPDAATFTDLPIAGTALRPSMRRQRVHWFAMGTIVGRTPPDLDRGKWNRGQPAESGDAVDTQ